MIGGFGAGVLGVASERLGPELIANGGFETNTDGWLSYGSVISRSVSEKYLGAASLEINDSSSFGSGSACTLFPAIAGATYKLVAYTKSYNLISIRIAHARDHNFTNYSIVGRNTVSAEWQQIQVYFIAPTTENRFLYFSCGYNENFTGTLYLDSVSLKVVL